MKERINQKIDELSDFLLELKEIVPLALKLRKAKGMRNIIVHEYGDLDDKLVFQAVSSKVQSDTEEFLKEIKKVL